MEVLRQRLPPSSIPLSSDKARTSRGVALFVSGMMMWRAAPFLDAPDTIGRVAYPIGFESKDRSVGSEDWRHHRRVII